MSDLRQLVSDSHLTQRDSRKADEQIEQRDLMSVKTPNIIRLQSRRTDHLNISVEMRTLTEMANDALDHVGDDRVTHQEDLLLGLQHPRIAFQLSP